MRFRLMRFVTLFWALCVVTAPQAAGAKENLIRPGDRVVTTTATPVKVGDKTRATVPEGKKLRVTAVKGSWVAVATTENGKSVTGWMAAKQLTPFRMPDITETEGVLKQTEEAPLGLTTPDASGWSSISFQNLALDRKSSYLKVCLKKRCGENWAPITTPSRPFTTNSWERSLFHQIGERGGNRVCPGGRAVAPP